MTGKGKKNVTVLAERLQEGVTEIERKFLLAAELGDIDVIQNLLESNSVSANKADTQGRTALDLAIASGQEDIVLYLIDKVSPKILHNGLISAVENGRAEICEIFLKHPMYQSPNSSKSRFRFPRESVASVDTDNLSVISEDNATPKTDNYNRRHRRKMLKEALMKAAIKNNFQIVQMIMLKGVCLDFPHDYFCLCKLCIYEQKKDYMVFCNNRLDTFRALASPAYITLTEEDPLMASFRLSKRFQELMSVETEYQQTYVELDQQVQQFSLDLLDQCRYSEEVRCLLSSGDGDDDDDYFPLLDTALKMKQKRFVAHAKCQAQVSALWFTGLQILRKMNRFEFLILSIPIGMVLLPILSVVYIVAPWSKVTLLLNNPSTRFLNYTCSFISFLCLVVIGKLQFSNIWLSLGCDVTQPYVYLFITLIFMWIIGWIWEEMKQVYTTGASDYFGSIWNINDSIMLTFLLASFTLDIVVPIRVSQSIQDNPIPINISGEILVMSMIPFCYSVAEGGNYKDASVCSSSPIAIKADWSPSWVPDPELISDVFFSIGIVLSIARISFIMPANETFGTMLVSFRRTFGDVIKLCAMFILILVSFSCGLAALYAAHQCQTKHFNGLEETFFILLWSLLSFGPSDAPKLNPTFPMSSITNNPSREDITVIFGYIFYGIYVFAGLVVLMNLLIAVMSNTFQEVQDEREIEWKFSRTELWMTFIKPGCPVAPPFNIIPTPRSILKFFRSLSDQIKDCCMICRKKNERLPSYNSSESDAKEQQKQKDKFRQETICTLIRRYIVFAEREKSEGDEDATEDKLRRLIERVASKQDKHLDEIETKITQLDKKVHIVHEGGNTLRGMQEHEIELTRKLIDLQDMYRDMQKKKWSEVNQFREERLQEIQRMRENRRKLLEERRLSEAQKLEENISDALEDAEFVPRTTVW